MDTIQLKAVSVRLKSMWSSSSEQTHSLKIVPRLLIVDDEETVCFSMSDYFSLHGYLVDTARDLAEASRLIAVEDYHVIIQDLRLDATGDKSGIHVIRIAHQKCPETRIVVLTAYGSGEIEKETRRWGASAFLQKPKPLSQVAQVVQNLIEAPLRKLAS